MIATKPLKILFVGDASNHNRALSAGLRSLGHEVTLASEGSGWMNTSRDIDLSRPLPGRLGGLALWLRTKHLLHSRLAGYDVANVISTNFISLRPERIRTVFDALCSVNKRVFNIALATDPFYIETCTRADSPLRYSEWMINGTPSRYHASARHHIAEWLNPDLYDLCRTIYDRTAGTVTDLYEYHLISRRYLPDDRLAYAGIPIEVDKIELSPIAERPKTVRLLLGRHANRQLEKGTDRLLAAARRVVERHPNKCSLDVVENVPYVEYLRRMSHADVVLDQLYSYTPATNALLAMAMGKVAVSGGEDDYYDFIGEKELRPIVNAIPDDDDALARQIEQLVVNPERLSAMGLQGRTFVERHNSAPIVAQRYIDFWKKFI